MNMPRIPTYLRRSLAVLTLLVCSGPVLAANYDLSGTVGGSNYPPCTGGSWSSSGSTRTCTGSITLAAGDTIIPGLLTGTLTLVVNAGITLQGNNTLGTTSIFGTRQVHVQTGWGPIQVNGSGNTIYGNLSSNNSTAINLSGTQLNGTITTNSTSNLTNSTVTGQVSANGGVTATGTTFGSNIITTSGNIELTGGSVTGNLSSNSGAINLDGTQLSGAINTNGTSRLINSTVGGLVRANNGVTTENTTVGGSVSASSGNISLTGGSVGGPVSANGTITTNNTDITGDVTSNSSTITINGGNIAGRISTPGGSGITISNAWITGGPVEAYGVPINISGSTLGSASSPLNVISHGNPVNLSDSTAVYGNVTAGNWQGALQIDNSSGVSGICTPTHPRCGTLPTTPQCLSDDFNRTDLGDNWSVTNKSGSFGNPRIVNNRLRLTNNSADVATASTFQRLFPSASNLVTLEFDFYAYGGSGADGVAVALSDAAVTPAPGAYGGSLGYANKPGIAGFAGGWLGIALDTYGNFSNPTEGRRGGPGSRSNAVAIRGSGSGEDGYAYITGTNTLNPTVRTSSGHRYRVTIDSQATGQARVRVERRTSSTGNFQTLVNWTNVLASSGQASVPQNLLLTLTGSTGGSNDNHEIDNVEICALRMAPVTAPVHHFRILHDGEGLTCAPETVTVHACANNSCTERYTGDVTVALQATGASAVAADGGFTNGIGRFKVSRGSNGDVELGVSSSTPTAANLTRCFRNGVEGSCILNFTSSGLVFDVPDLVSGKASGEIEISASCAGSSSTITGQRTVRFRSSYVDPDGNPYGTQVEVQGEKISNASTGTTPIALTFDSNSKARIQVRYPDAGAMTLHAEYTGSASTGDAGLSLTGSDNFIVKPAGFCVTSPDDNALCSAGNHTCGIFRKAGEAFRLTVRPVIWESDTDTDLCTPGNLTTQNYRQENVVLGSELVAPTGGEAGVTGTDTLAFDAAHHGIRTIPEQSISEVGVFRFTAKDTNYFGAGEILGHSQPIGRFIPASFTVTASQQAACTTATPPFTYAGLTGHKIGQGFGITADISARNQQGNITRNYRGSFMQLSQSGLSGTAMNAAGEVYPDGALASWSVNSLQMTNGSGSMAATARFAFTALHAPVAIGVRVTATDTDQVTGHHTSDTAEQRIGRLAVGSGHSHLESAPLTINAEAQFYDGTAYLPNVADGCTVIPSNLISLNGTVSDQTGLAGSYSPAVTGGQLPLPFTAPDISGFIDATIQVPEWLRYDWDGNGFHDNDPTGRASWGLYRGNPNVIRLREVWR